MSGTQGSTAGGGDDSGEKFESDTDTLVERARQRLVCRRRVRLVSVSEDEEDVRDKDSRDKSSS